LTLTTKRVGRNPVFGDLKDRIRELETTFPTHTERAALLGFARLYTEHIDPEEESAFSPEFVINALLAQYHTLLAAEPGDHCAIEVTRGSELLRIRCQADSVLAIESVFVPLRAKGTVISIVSNDMDFLVDTFLQTIRERTDRFTTLHPILERAALTKAGVPIRGHEQAKLCSFFTAALPMTLTKVEAEQLLRALARRYHQLYRFNRDRDRMLGDLLWLVEHSTFPGDDKVEPAASKSVFAHFLPFAEIRRPRRAPRVDLGIERPEVSIDRHWPRGLAGNYRIQVLPARSEILDLSHLRAVTFRLPEGEVDFVGLFRPQRTGSIGISSPEVAARLERVRTKLNLLPTSHSYRSLQDLISSLNVDTVLALPNPELLELCRLGLLMEELGTTQTFLYEPVGGPRRLLVLVPAHRATVGIEARIQDAIEEVTNGICRRLGRTYTDRRLTAEFALLGSDGPIDLQRLQADLERATTPWRNRIRSLLRERYDGEELSALAGTLDLMAEGLEDSYQQEENEDFVLADIQAVTELLGTDKTMLARLLMDAKEEVHLHLVVRGERPSLSQLLPVIESFGFDVFDEQPYRGRVGDKELWVIDLGLTVPSEGYRERLHADRVRARVEAALVAIWDGTEESDELCRLMVEAELTELEVAVLRTLASYLRLTALGYSQQYARRVLVAEPQLARLLVRLFMTRFDPELSELDRSDLTASLAEQIDARLGEVASLDQDKVLRSIKALILAMTRTNCFHDERAAIAFKLDPRPLAFLPEPKPRFEIYLRSATTEAVHLRGGPIARGGIRFSDRTEDFRTEILGLMKAQTVKNAVIVPVGAKGGFIVKDLDPSGRNTAKVERSYRLFMETLLSLTDNLVGGKVVHPLRTVCHDGEDHYLVVAADKGTATFSDIANEIAERRGFWLGDAFASGGSHGFDHKKMGITAKGAWVSVAHHFDGLGIDVERMPFTVAGIGDLSGDVFGNGMLRSRQIKLVAAFDHRHIFLDPSPDPEASWQARAAVFALGAGTTWEQYPKEAISDGGGVYPRSAKSIELSPQAAEALGVAPGRYEPNQVIRAILTAPVDLLFNGGIGTYVKASTESNLEVGDKANDAVRINGAELRARVVGEGGNLGMTQRGRIEYCLTGGRCNTDSIDNSAGVDTSDHEVNIKIALDALVTADRLTRDQRNEILGQCEAEVEAQVLSDNVYQNWALSAAEAHYARSWGEIQRLLERLVATAGLSPAVEDLPDPSAIAQTTPSRPLTRAELAIIISYVKLDLYQCLLGSSLLEHPLTDALFEEYFPLPVRQRLGDLAGPHPLRRELLATTIANLVVNCLGIFGIEEISSAANITHLEAAEYAFLAIAITEARPLTRSLLWATSVDYHDRMEAYLGLTDLLCTTALELRQVTKEPAALFDLGRISELQAKLRTVAQLLADAEEVPEAWRSRLESMAEAGIDPMLRSLLGPGRSLAVYVAALAERPTTDPEELARELLAREGALALPELRELLASLPSPELSTVLAKQQIQDRLNRLGRSLMDVDSPDPSLGALLADMQTHLAQGDLLQALLESLRLADA
jgi:glutamate dehydrogenase